jgi:hypothetical protein
MKIVLAIIRSNRIIASETNTDKIAGKYSGKINFIAVPFDEENKVESFSKETGNLNQTVSRIAVNLFTG